ncbi:MAG: hypothetical protein IBX69_07170 [Anaerolineales bacterium]|nr:hypothetical protein [Anaerolineales bacterium]
MDDLVECHSGSRYAERPTALHWQGERLEITEINKRWRTPHGIGFWVQTTTDQQFELFYQEASDQWQLKEIYHSKKEAS